MAPLSAIVQLTKPGIILGNLASLLGGVAFKIPR